MKTRKKISERILFLSQAISHCHFRSRARTASIIQSVILVSRVAKYQSSCSTVPLNLTTFLFLSPLVLQIMMATIVAKPLFRTCYIVQRENHLHHGATNFPSQPRDFPFYIMGENKKIGKIIPYKSEKKKTMKNTYENSGNTRRLRSKFLLILVTSRPYSFCKFLKLFIRAKNRIISTRTYTIFREKRNELSKKFSRENK